MLDQSVVEQRRRLAVRPEREHAPAKVALDLPGRLRVLLQEQLAVGKKRDTHELPILSRCLLS